MASCGLPLVYTKAMLQQPSISLSPLEKNQLFPVFIDSNETSSFQQMGVSHFKRRPAPRRFCFPAERSERARGAAPPRRGARRGARGDASRRPTAACPRRAPAAWGLESEVPSPPKKRKKQRMKKKCVGGGGKKKEMKKK